MPPHTATVLKNAMVTRDNFMVSSSAEPQQMTAKLMRPMICQLLQDDIRSFAELLSLPSDLVPVSRQAVI